jgi:DNA-nicking Smr family endonuclease
MSKDPDRQDEPDEEELFASEMSGVVPLPEDGRATPVAVAREPTPAQLARQRAAVARDGDPNPLTLGEVPPVGPWDELAWKRDGVQEGVYRKLRLGKYGLDASLDLHRRTVREARDDLWRFVEDCIRHNLRTVLVSHGRGERSETPGRIKSYVAAWLPELEGVLAFHSARRQDGGYGAVYVLLRKSPERRNDNRERFARRTP